MKTPRLLAVSVLLFSGFAIAAAAANRPTIRPAEARIIGQRFVELSGSVQRDEREAILDAKRKAFAQAVEQDADVYRFEVVSITLTGGGKQAKVRVSW